MILEMDLNEKIESIPVRHRAALTSAGLAAVFLSLVAWIFHYGATLINDEYAAIDYIYRVMDQGFFPTPHKLHKPLSLVMGLASRVTESPLGYEILVAAFAAVFVFFLYLAAKETIGKWPALAAAMAVAAHPDLMYYSCRGSTILPFCALCFAGLYAAILKDKIPRALFIYAVCFFLAGLIRPEAWLFGGPPVIWWWPGLKDKKGLIRLFAALCIIGMGPVIWFGKDLLINGDLMHGIHVATRDKAVGTGAPFTALTTLNFFRVRIPNKISWPLAWAGLAGAAWFFLDLCRESGGGLKGAAKAVLHPFIVSPIVVSFYVWLIVYMGVYPVQRYWYFDAVFAVIFAAYLAGRLLPLVSAGYPAALKMVVIAASLAGAFSFAVSGPRASDQDGYWLLAVAGFFSLFLASAMLWGREAVTRYKEFSIVALLVVMAGSYLAFLGILYPKLYTELEEEAKVQKEITRTATFLMNEIPPGRGDRVLIPSRRNEQLNWEFRDREIPDVVMFREAFYLNEFKGVDFLDLHPDWIVYIDKDYQFWGPDKMFKWLSVQDHANLGGVKIDLATELDRVRVFSVDYPPGHPAKAPLPPIP